MELSAAFTIPNKYGLHARPAAEFVKLANRFASDIRVRQMFWQAGPQKVQDAFKAFLEARAAAGELDVPDIARAVPQFFCLLKGELHMRMASGLCGTPSKRDVDAHIDATVDLFLRAYGAR